MDSYFFVLRIKFSFRTELKEPLGHRSSTVRDPSRLGLNFKVAHLSV
jgi:hypothetical protein